jgi:hypothetical protein
VHVPKARSRASSGSPWKWLPVADKNMRHLMPSDSFIHLVDHDKNLLRPLRELPNYRTE